MSLAAAATRRTFLTLGGGLTGAVLLGSSATALGMPSIPKIHMRHEWEAHPPRIRATILDEFPDRLVVHHTASPNQEDTSVEAAYALSRAIQRHHMLSNGWDDIGEQFTISRGGHVMEGRNRTWHAVRYGRHVVGAHAANHNRHALGIETEGTYMTELPPSDQLEALVCMLAWLCWNYYLQPHDAIIGHRDLNATSCPGDRFYAFLPELRDLVYQRIRKEERRVYRRGTPSTQQVSVQGGFPGPRHVFDHGPEHGPMDLVR
ncbi:peptidoglycan recognition protein family protein [Acrocarpospora catenulata]|uniref:peptidoglycan recognition protein family protein n=1 Tax=Acrocarpospora catenulata TaxID=2836182 RepID=UPI001BDA97DB|nr:peptidoglycan recognition family protein [Acrocarpospora catenulata]